MSTESLIFFALVLVVWGLSATVRWLREQMDNEETTEVKHVEYFPAAQLDAVQKSDKLPLLDKNYQPMHLRSTTSVRVPPKNIRRWLKSGSPQVLRQGIILMSVLGSCRAFEPMNDKRLF